MSAVYASGVLPLPGDKVPISPAVAPLAVGTDVLTVCRTHPCDTPGWAYLVGTWRDGRPSRVMVWLDRIIVRRAR